MEESFLRRIFTDVLGHFVWWFCVVILSVGVYMLTERRQIRRFFGIHNASSRRIRILVSRVNVKPGAAPTLETDVEGFDGVVISLIEYKAALLLQRKLQSIFLLTLPQVFRDWLRDFNPNLTPIVADIEPSPASSADDKLKHDNLVVLGSSNYNTLTKDSVLIFGPQPRTFHFRYEAHKLSIYNHETDETFPARTGEKELGIIERLRSEKGCAVFICAGAGQGATYGTVKYLVDNWSSLHREYGKGNFGICLNFPKLVANTESDDHERIRDPEVLYKTRHYDNRNR